MISFDRTALTVFGLSIHWYGLLIVLGVALAVLLGIRREKRFGLPKDTSLDLVLIGLPAALIGARLYFVVFSWDQYAGGPWWKAFAIWEGGLAIYGGLMGGIAAGAVYARVKRLPFPVLADLAAPGFAIGQAVGRWGNFLNREAYGVEVGVPALRFFPAAVRIGETWHYATFFYESVWCFGIAAALLLMEHRGRLRRRGDGFLTYVLLYAVERAAVEGLRTDSLWWGGVRVSQALSLALALAVTVLWALRNGEARPVRRAAAPVAMAAAVALSVAGASGASAAVSAAAAALSIAVYLGGATDNGSEMA